MDKNHMATGFFKEKGFNFYQILDNGIIQLECDFIKDKRLMTTVDFQFLPSNHYNIKVGPRSLTDV